MVMYNVHYIALYVLTFGKDLTCKLPNPPRKTKGIERREGGLTAAQGKGCSPEP